MPGTTGYQVAGTPGGRSLRTGLTSANSTPRAAARGQMIAGVVLGHPAGRHEHVLRRDAAERDDEIGVCSTIVGHDVGRRNTSSELPTMCGRITTDVPLLYELMELV